MIRYTLYTEDKEGTVEGILELVSKYFEGATIQRGVGLWRGKSEYCLKIELMVDETNIRNDIKLESLVSDIKIVNDQETVMVVKDNPIIWYL